MTNGQEIAVIGMACRYPGATNGGEFWANLRDGKESITRFRDEELLAAGVARELLDDPGYVKARGILGDHALFDAGFFNINPREAELIDPQHRHFLECAWEALEDSGYAASRAAASAGVYAGCYENGYRLDLESRPELIESVGWLPAHLGGEKDYLASRVSYKLDLRGPSIAVQTACSTSLVAVHLAAQALLGGECDLALAGGSTVRARWMEGYRYEPEGILSPDGHCRAFDAAARGTVSSSGVGVVVLKRLGDALRDRDTIRAVILGSAVTNDGAAKVGFSAPSVDGQARAVRIAQLAAGIDPSTIGYVEAHGSGTALGDPIEVAALTTAFRAHTAESGFCVIGSVKANIGHTHAASGMAGLIKAALALEHRQIPPSLHYERSNPEIEFERSPFRVATALSEWKSNSAPRRAAVNSAGTGGTNAHIILEEAPARHAADPAAPSRPWQLLLLSGRSSAAVEAATDRLAGHLREHPEQHLADVAYTLQVGRKALDYRQALVCDDAADAAEALASRDLRRLLRQSLARGERSIAFMFSGLGEQYPQMARDLYNSEPVFRAEVDRCADLFAPHLGLDLRTVLYPEGQPQLADTAAAPTGLDLHGMLGRGTQASGPLDRTRHAQPVMFMVEWALAQLWTSWGIRPQALIGYSIGEWVAAAFSGVLSLEDAAFLVARRALLIEQMPGGAMLAVSLPEAEAAQVDDRLCVAAVNGPAMTVLAGETDVIELAGQRLTRSGIANRRLRTTHAFHSRAMEAGAAEFTALTQQVTLRPPQVPYLSNLTGTWITAAEATCPDHWTRHMCQAVRFSAGAEELWRAPGRILLEVGPGQAAASLALQLLPRAEADTRMALPSLPSVHDGQPSARVLRTALGRLWLAGIEPDWEGVHAGEPRGRVPLPTYPFERQRYWIEPRVRPPGAPRQAPDEPLRKLSDISRWFSVPSWAFTAPLAPIRDDELAEAPRRWLLFADELGYAARIAARLERAGLELAVVTAADRFERRGNRHFTIAPGRRADYDKLLRQLGEWGMPEVVVHLWTVTGPASGAPVVDGFDASQARGFYSLLFLVQAWAARGGEEPLHLAVVSDGLRQVLDAEIVFPEKATVTGPCTVAPQEHPQLTSQSIDIGFPDPDSPTAEQTAEYLITEIIRRPADPVVAYRGRRRWKPRWEQVPVPRARHRPTRLRQDGVYLITGGLGGMGLALAEYLAQTVRARLVLVGRSPLPDRQTWPSQPGGADETASRMQKVRVLEQQGAKVLVLRADVTDREQMRAALAAARERFGVVHGVIHAAGVVGGGIIQLKRPETAAKVIAPKALGALVLDEVTKDLPLDFMLLCSSTIAFAGGPGQVDYCAANAFLDAFAHARTAAGRHTVCVNWDAWQEVGMAVKAIGQGAPGQAAAPHAVGHPLLHTLLSDAGGRAVYSAEFRADRDWLVDEHRMLGYPVIPGTAFLEMVRAALAHQGLGDQSRFDEVLFLAPAVLEEHRAREVRVVLDKRGDGFGFTVISSPGSGTPDESSWVEHVTGRVAPSPDAADAGRWDPSAVIEQFGLSEVGELRLHEPMRFGPRSQCLDRVWSGRARGLARLALPERFADDLDQLGLHPFLLDVATGFAALYLERDYLMPLRYRSLRVSGRLPTRFYSLLEYREAPAGARETAAFDVTLFDEQGRELARAEEFVMKKARALETKLPALRDGTSDEVIAYSHAGTGNAAGDGLVFLAHLETGIRSAEGVEAFERLLARELAPQVVVAAKDISALTAHVGATGSAAPGALAAPGAAPSPARTYARPSLPTPYAAPGNDVERDLAELWQEQIGVERVGVHDNFFDLGGHSLMGIRLLARLRETLYVTITLQKMFSCPTVAELAKVVSELRNSGRDT